MMKYLFRTSSNPLTYLIQVVFSAFTDSFQKVNIEERLKSSAKVVSSMLKSWPGIFQDHMLPEILNTTF